MELKTIGKQIFKHPVIIAAVLILSSFLLCPQPSGAQEYDFFIQTPTDWQNRTDGLNHDLKKQVMAPGEDAFIEVYATKGQNIGVQEIADTMEQAALTKGAVYFQNRVSSQNIHADGNPAIMREYTGYHNGILLRCYALYTYGNGGYFMVIGVFVDNQTAKYKNLVYQCVKSLRFSPPAHASVFSSLTGGKGLHGGTVSPDDYSSTSNEGFGCNGIVGKWKWFTGSTAEFGPNGTIPGNGNRWECVDGGNVFKVIWNNGQWIDTLTLSADGMRLEGKNQIGNRVWGQRIGPPPATGEPSGQTYSHGDFLDKSCCQLFGTWNWAPPGVHCVFMPDHKFLWQSKSYRYDCGGGKVTVHWGDRKTTVLNMVSPSLMTFVDEWKITVNVTRLTDYVVIDGKTYKACSGGSALSGNATTGFGCSGIVGKWKWFTGSTAEFGPNGTIPGNGNRWECVDGGNVFKVIWNNGQWIDTLTLSADGMRLEGKNQIGNRVWGQRIGPPPNS